MLTACAVSPGRIPWAILSGDHDHRERYLRDKGVRFEPLSDKVHPFDEWGSVPLV